MRVSVEREICQGHALCHGICPEVFELDDLGFATTKDVEVPDQLADAVRNAERTCPEQAIVITP